MLSIIAIWLISIAMLAALGSGLFLLVHWITGFKIRALPAFVDWPIIGLIAAWMFATLYTLLQPAKNGLTLFCLILAWICAFGSRDIFIHNKRKFRRAKKLGLAFNFLIFMLFAAICAWQAAGENVVYDTNLYHFHAVAWIRDHGLVPGLANLHSRLGYHSSFHTFATFFEYGFLKDKSSHLALGLLCLLTFLKYLATIRQSLQRQSQVFLRNFLLLSVPLFLNYGFDTSISSLSADSALTFICALTLLYLSQIPSLSPRQMRTLSKFRIVQLQVPIACGLAAIAFSIKFPSLSVVCITTGLSIILLLSAFSAGHLKYWKLTIWALGGCIFYSGLHITGTIILSGYPFFPLPYLPLDLQWTVPLERAQYELHAIKSWARMRSTDSIPPFLQWFGPWLSNYWKSAPIIYLSLSGAMLITCIVYRVKKKLSLLSIPVPALVIIGATVLYTLIWFVGAPDVRFLGGVHWILFAAVCSLMLKDLFPVCWATPIAGLILLFVLIHTNLLTPPLIGPKSLFSIEPARSLPTAPRLTGGSDADAFQVFVPLVGDLCGNSHLPCTPIPDDRLRLRVPGNLANGLYIEPNGSRNF